MKITKLNVRIYAICLHDDVLNWVLSLDELPTNNINIPPLETSYAPAEKLAGFNFV